MTEVDWQYQIEKVRRELEVERAVRRCLEDLIVRLHPQPKPPAFDPNSFPQNQW